MNPTDALIQAQIQTAVAKAVEQVLGLHRAPAASADYAAMTIPEFCDAYRVSRGLLYLEWQRGRGPPKFKIGRRTLISQAAALSWLAEREMEEAERVAAKAVG